MMLLAALPLPQSLWLAMCPPQARTTVEAEALKVIRIREDDDEAFRLSLQVKATTRADLPRKGRSCHTGRVALLRAIWPRARFVYIHRDPYAVSARPAT